MRLAILATMNLLQAIVITCLCIAPPRDNTARDSVATIELNCFYDLDGRLVFEQAIFRDTDNSIRAWRLVKSPSQIPQRDWANGGYVATWVDGEVMRQVRCESVLRTYTQYDVELVERDVLPKEQRRDLSR